jgi:PAS domain S-box-containing protein
MHALEGTPMALSFASVAIITLLTGFWPGLVGAVFNTVFFNHYALAVRGTAFSLNPADLIRTITIFLVGLLIAYLCERQRVSQRQVQSAHASLQAQAASLMDAQQVSNSATWSYNVQNRQMRWAEGGAEVLGRPFPEVSRLESLAEAVAPEDRARFEEAVEDALRTSEPFQIEFRVRWPNGEIHWLETRGTHSPTDPNLWRGVTIDTTERKSTEIALIRSEKLAAIGRLSATIAHEINNPLEAVTNLLYLATSDSTLKPETRQYLRDADRELTRLANIARRTLTFVRSRSSMDSANVDEVVENVVAMFQPRCAARGAEIRLNIADSLRIAVPPDDLWQILTNLVANACDALNESAGFVELCTIRENGFAAIYVCDNGVGIAPENLDRIFDPFFTTKPEVGTGIGLWVTKDLVEQNGGNIGVEPSNPSAHPRTTFRIQFPLA